jgi:ABC-type transport system involved in cytochrome c biogenesis ATPase subunit
MWNQVINTPQVTPLLQWQGLQILPGLNAVTGDEGSGKTRLLRELSASNADAVWLDLRLPEHDEHTPEEVWSALRAQHRGWNNDLQHDLADAFQLSEHLGKRLFMLSAGSRRKVALVGLLASGATITCLDQPYAALDMASIRVLREFLSDMSAHPSRAWVIADFELDSLLKWHSSCQLQSN